MSEEANSELKPASGSATPELEETAEEESKKNSDETNDQEMKDGEKEDEEEKKKKEEELRKKYADWPLKGIKDPHDNDVMYGRGGGTNHHPGNKRYRKMVEDRKLEYVNSKRLDKPLVALEIIRIWRAQVPPGRFLKLDEKTGLWHDVGDKKAREKTSQALREKAPLIRKQQEDDGKEDSSGDTKTTRFAEGTKEEDASVKKAVLARDHSLGREYIEAGEAVSLDGFSWQDPFQSKQRESSYGRPAGTPTAYPAGRNSSHGSLGMAPPHHASIGGPPPPPDYWGRVNGPVDRQREYSNGRFESWGNTSFGYAPPPPGPPGHPMHQRSGSWTHGPPLPPGPSMHQRSGSWGSGREHSLGMFPLIGASISNAADRDTFDSGRSAQGFWAEQAGSPVRGGPPPPPPPPPAYGAPVRSGGSLGPYREPYRQAPSPANSTPSPKPVYNVDLNIAKTWSGVEMQNGWQNGPAYDGMPHPIPGADQSPMRGPSGSIMPRPQMVKRDTSHQNENYETKPMVKRAALNRDNSLASNRLKQEYMPEYFSKKFDADQEMRSLSTNFEQSTLDNQQPKPKAIGDGERVSTMDVIAMDLMVKPAPILKDDRVSTIDALDLDLDTEGTLKDFPRDDLPRPNSLEATDRLTTKDFMDLVNSPIAQVDPNAPKTEGDDPLPLNQEKLADEWLTQV